MTTVRTARGLIGWYMRAFDFKGWTSLWNVIYVTPGWEDVGWLIRHEQTHIDQMKRDGKWKFMALYMWWSLRYGYSANPYEVEARASENREHHL